MKAGKTISVWAIFQAHWLNLQPAQEWGTLMFFCDYQSPGLTGAFGSCRVGQWNGVDLAIWPTTKYIMINKNFGMTILSNPKHPHTQGSDDGIWKSQEVASVKLLRIWQGWDSRWNDPLSGRWKSKRSSEATMVTMIVPQCRQVASNHELIRMNMEKRWGFGILIYHFFGWLDVSGLDPYHCNLSPLLVVGIPRENGPN